MTVTQTVRGQQQQWAGELARQNRPHVNPYGTPGMSLNDAGDWRKLVPVDEKAAQQVKKIAFDHMKNDCGVSDGEDIAAAIRDYVMSLAPEKRLSASWTLNEIFHNEANRLGEFVRQRNPDWNWVKPTSILDGYKPGFDIQA